MVTKRKVKRKLKKKKRYIKCSNCKEPIKSKVAYVKQKPYCQDCVYFAHKDMRREFK